MIVMRSAGLLAVVLALGLGASQTVAAGPGAGSAVSAIDSGALPVEGAALPVDPGAFPRAIVEPPPGRTTFEMVKSAGHVDRTSGLVIEAAGELGHVVIPVATTARGSSDATIQGAWFGVELGIGVAL